MIKQASDCRREHLFVSQIKNKNIDKDSMKVSNRKTEKERQMFVLDDVM